MKKEELEWKAEMLHARAVSDAVRAALGEKPFVHDRGCAEMPTPEEQRRVFCDNANRHKFFAALEKPGHDKCEFVKCRCHRRSI
jgi:hypothetical protein